jgi:hypothetical protein
MQPVFMTGFSVSAAGLTWVAPRERLMALSSHVVVGREGFLFSPAMRYW